MERVLILYPCSTFRQRLFGLHGFGALGTDQGLWIWPCRAVHTLGLHQALDIVFLDAHDQILRVCPDVRSNRSVWCWRASAVVELSAGFCRAHVDYADQIMRACRLTRQRLKMGVRI